METITPKWDKTNLENINKNFGEVKEVLADLDDIPNKINESLSEAKGEVERTLDGYFTALGNLFNKNGELLPETSIATTGAFYPRAGYSATSKPIRVKGATSYQATASYYHAQFDKAGNFLKYAFVPYKTALVTEADAYTITLGIGTSAVSTFMFAEGSEVLTAADYVEHSVVLNGANDAQVLAASEGYVSLNARLSGIDQAINDLGGDSLQVSDEEAEAIFIQSMNELAQRIGMVNSKFVNSSGLTGAGQTSTALDFALLAKHCLGYESLLRVWGAKKYTVSVKGSNARSVAIETSVKDPTFESSYTILGGKTGTLGVNINLLGVFQGSNGKIYAASILKADSDRWAAMKQLLDGNSTIDAVGGFAIEIKEPGVLFQNIEGTIANQKDPTTKISPASCTKTLTALVMLESGIGFNETIELKDSDIQTGSGPALKAGDQFNILDALYLMMLPSSNTAAKAVARVVGKRIAMSRGYK